MQVKDKFFFLAPQGLTLLLRISIDDGKSWYT